MDDRIIKLLEILTERTARLERLAEAELTADARRRVDAIRADRGAAVNPFAIMSDQFKADGRAIWKDAPPEPPEADAVEALEQSTAGQEAQQAARSAWDSIQAPAQRAAATLEAAAAPGTNGGLALVAAAAVAGVGAAALLDSQRRLAELPAGRAEPAALATPEAQEQIAAYLAEAADPDRAMALLMLAWNRTGDLGRAIEAASGVLN